MTRCELYNHIICLSFTTLIHLTKLDFRDRTYLATLFKVCVVVLGDITTLGYHKSCANIMMPTIGLSGQETKH